MFLRTNHSLKQQEKKLDQRTSQETITERFSNRSLGILYPELLPDIDEKVNQAIKLAYIEYRFFPLTIHPDLRNIYRSSRKESEQGNRLNRIKDQIIEEASREDQNVFTRLSSDVRLGSRIKGAVEFLHKASLKIESPDFLNRRIVLIKEEKGIPAIFRDRDGNTVIAHIGAGPLWEEKSTIYIGLALFDLLREEKKAGKSTYFNIFCQLLEFEERAIQTGYYHTDHVSAEFRKSLHTLVEDLAGFVTADYQEVPEPSLDLAPARFTHSERDRILRMLDARTRNDIMNFDYDLCIQAMDMLEEMASRYKSLSDERSLRETVRLLVSASGHDIHEVRNRANIALERVFSPREYEAPLATRFRNVRIGEQFELAFRLPETEKGSYFIRIYRSKSSGGLFLQRDMDTSDVPLKKSESKEGEFIFSGSFDYTGQVDFLVYHLSESGYDWVNEPGTSGRINIMPDVSGEIVLEIFTDIHGHSGIYWKTSADHPGLVYNESGNVIRLGQFSDVSAHLKEIKEKYMITALYLLGVQTRGSNREDWAPNASSPSPFSPMSLTTVEDFLGGEEEFRELVKTAHSLDIKVIVDVVPHLNRRSTELPESCEVQCYDGSGNLVTRASTDGRFGSWNDGKLLNYRMFEIWEWLADSVVKLITDFDLDGVRFDSAHAVPIMMKKNNFPFVYDRRRSSEEMVEGRIIVNDTEYGAMVTTGYYDAQCRDMIAVPLHYYLMLRVENALRETGKNYFIYLAECYWGHERFLARSGVIPYNSALFKICENIIHGTSDVREIYHVYDSYFPGVLPEGTAMLGILGNHDERRGLNTFGHRGVRAAVGLTIFLSEIVMDYEGSAEGEGWKVFLDNIYVNWNQFEFASHRSLEPFYREWYGFHRKMKGRGYMIWANNHMVAAAVKFVGDSAYIGAFNFSDTNQHATLQFDNPGLGIEDDSFFIIEDPVYSPITTGYSYYSGMELKSSRITTVISYTDRVKILTMRKIENPAEFYFQFLKDSFFRLCQSGSHEAFGSNFAYREIVSRLSGFDEFANFIKSNLIDLFSSEDRYLLELGIKRALYHAYLDGIHSGNVLLDYMDRLALHTDSELATLGAALKKHNRYGSFVFLSAEAEPFSRSGGLGNVVYELPRELVNQNEEAYVITGMYAHGDDKAVKKMEAAKKKYGVKYTGVSVRFFILDAEYEVGVFSCVVDGVKYFLLDHYEFFDGLYWGITAYEKIRKRVAFARAAAEVICHFQLKPHFVLTNDAYAGIFQGLVRTDPTYYGNENFAFTTFLHMIHNGGWQYFDAYERNENGFDLFKLLNIPEWLDGNFLDPVHGHRINCMATGVRFADRVITVSPSYASQIEYACDGLEHILHNVIGISNAIGNDFVKRIFQNYRESGFVETHYPLLQERIESDSVLRKKLEKDYPELLSPVDVYRELEDPNRKYTVARIASKLMLQLERGFDVDPDIVLFTMIHRVTEQKGYQLLLDASEGLFKNLGYQAIIGGAVSSGDKRGEEIAHGLWLLSTYYPSQVSVNFGFQDVSIPLLSTDLFCMPSMNEPGGIAQLEAFAGGSLVVARATGGLRDTVAPVMVNGEEVQGNGFLFSDFSPHAFYDAMERAHTFFSKSKKSTILSARKNAEKSVYYWDKPAREYIETLYGIKEIIRIIQ